MSASKFLSVIAAMAIVILSLSSRSSMSGEPIDDLILQLGSKNPEMSEAAAKELIRSYGLAAVPQLSQALKNQNWRVRANAAIVLANIKPRADEAVPELQAALSDEDWHVRVSAATALISIGVAVDTLIPVLKNSLKRSETSVRVAAATALGNLGSKAQTAKDDLIATLDPKDPWVCEAAAIALQMIERRKSELQKGKAAVEIGDFDAARHHFKAGARNGDREAKWSLDFLEIFEAISEAISNANQRKFEALLPKFIKVAKSGNAVAQYHLAYFYIGGLIRSAPSEANREAFMWFSQAAQAGLSEAQFELGNAYSFGVDHIVEKNLDHALHWYEKAANQGNAEAQFELGSMYLTGEDIPVNKLLAYKWFTIATVQDIANISFAARSNREKLISEMKPEALMEARHLVCLWFAKSY